jgi:IPT/TIG domain/Listeria-Bacteroides repeat domain (List_Bact_rpt)
VRWNQVSVVALLALVASFCLGAGGITTAAASTGGDVNAFGSLQTGMMGALDLENSTNAVGQQTPEVTMLGALLSSSPVSLLPGAPSSLTLVPLPFQVVYFSVESRYGIWYPLCSATTDAGGVAECTADAPSIFETIDGAPPANFYPQLSAWSVTYVGSTVNGVSYSSSSDYGRIAGSPVPDPTPIGNGGITIVPQRYVSGCKPPDPNAPTSFISLWTDGGNCQLVALEQEIAPALLGAALIVTGGLVAVALDAMIDSVLTAAAQTLVTATGNLSIVASYASLDATVGLIAATVTLTAAVTAGNVVAHGNIDVGSGGDLQIESGVVVHNSDTWTNNGTIGGDNNGSGTIDNTGTIVNDGTIPGSGQGNGGVLITGNNYRLNFDQGAGPGSAPAPLIVLAPNVAASTQSLPTPTPPSGDTFTGWFTAADGGTQVTDSTDLSALLPTGPSSTTLYAHYVLSAGLQTATQATGASAVFGPKSQDVALSAEVIADAGTINEGSVTFSVLDSSNHTIGSTTTAPVLDGAASTVYTLPANLAAGSYEVKANYSDSAGLYQNSGDGANVTVATAPTTTVGAVSTSYSGDEEQVPVSAQVTSGVGTVNEGMVTFSLQDGSQQAVTTTASVSNGGASTELDIPAGLTNGDYTILGTYSDPGGSYAGSSDVEPGGLPQSVVIPNPEQSFVVGGSWFVPDPFSDSIFNTFQWSGLDPASTGCTDNNDHLQFTAVGTCILDGTAPAEDGFAATPVSVRVPIGPAPNYPEVTKWVTSPTVGSSFTPVVTSLSGLPATVSVDPDSVSICSMFNGVVTLNKLGNCHLDFTTATTSQWVGSTTEFNAIGVTSDPQSIYYSTMPSPTVGSSYPLFATSDSLQSATLSVDPSATGVCSLSSGLVTFTAAGSCEIDGSVGASGNYAAASSSETLSVAPGPQNIYFSTPPTDAVVGGTFVAAATSDSGSPVQLSIDPSSSGQCTISGSTVTFTHIGSCEIDGSVAASANYTSAAGSQTLTVVSAPTPVVTSLTPGSGPVTGGTAIDIKGTGFASGDKVVIGQGHGSGTGAIAATHVSVLSSTEITADTGGGASAGTTYLYVVGPSSKISVATAAGRFSYLPAVPAVTSLSPDSGPVTGGTAIDITGTGFVNGDKVVIGQGHGSGAGAIAATHVSVLSSTEITAVTGSGANPGSTYLYVVSPTNKASAAVPAGRFTYQLAVPAVTSLSPNSGPVTGGTAIDITGTGFVSGDKVVIGQGHGSGAGAIAATHVSVVSSTEITAVTGGGANAGSTYLYVVSPTKQASVAVVAGRFKYKA